MVLFSMVSKILCLKFHLNCDALDIQEVAKEWGGGGGGSPISVESTTISPVFYTGRLRVLLQNRRYKNRVKLFKERNCLTRSSIITWNKYFFRKFHFAFRYIYFTQNLFYFQNNELLPSLPQYYDNLELNSVLVVCDIKDCVFSSFLLYYTTQTERFVSELCSPSADPEGGGGTGGPDLPWDLSEVGSCVEVKQYLYNTYM